MVKNVPKTAVTDTKTSRKHLDDIVPSIMMGMNVSKPKTDQLMSWKERYELILESNKRLHERIQTLERKQQGSNTKSNTMIVPLGQKKKDAFVQELLEENRHLLQKYRALEIRMTKMDVHELRKGETPSSATGSKKKSKSLLPKKHVSVQTETPDEEKEEEEDSVGNKKKKKQVEEANNNQLEEMTEIGPLVQLLKKQLSELELDLERLQRENILLRKEVVNSTSTTTSSKRSLDSRLDDQMQVESLVRDRQRQLNYLEIKYTNLEEKHQAQVKLYQDVQTNNNQLTEQVYELKKQLTETRHQLELTKDEQNNVQLIQQELYLARSENLKLHEAIETLSTRPFDDLTQEMLSKNILIGKLEAENKELTQKNVQLQHDILQFQQQKNFLKEKTQQKQQENDFLFDEKQKLTQLLQENQLKMDVLTLQLKFYTKPHDEQMLQQIGHALRHIHTTSSSPPPKQPQQNDDQQQQKDQHSVQAETNRADGATRNFEQKRAIKMMELTNLLRQETKSQLENVQLIHAQEKLKWQRQRKQLDQQVKTQLKQIEQLQQDKAQLLKENQLVLTTSTRAPKIQHYYNNNHTIVQRDQEEDLDCNVLEILFQDIELTSVSNNSSSNRPSTCPQEFFLLCDYYDYETQASRVVTAAKSSSVNSKCQIVLNFQVSFKFFMSIEFFMSSLSREMKIELYQVTTGGSKSQLVAMTTFSLQNIFESNTSTTKKSLQELEINLQNPFNHHIQVGQLKIKASLQKPVYDLIQACGQVANKRLDPFTTLMTTTSTSSRSSHSSHSSHSSRTKNTSASGHLKVNVVSFMLRKNELTECFSMDDLTLEYRFMGYPKIQIPINMSANTCIVSLNHQRIFEMDTLSKEFIQFFCTRQLTIQLISTITGNNISTRQVLSQVDISFQELLSKHQLNCCTLKLIDPETSTLMGILSVQVELTGAMTSSIPRSIDNQQHMCLWIRRCFESTDEEGVKWIEVGHLNQLLHALPMSFHCARQLIHDHIQAHQSTQCSFFKFQRVYKRLLRRNNNSTFQQFLEELWQQSHFTWTLMEKELLTHWLTQEKGRDLLQLVVDTCETEWLQLEPTVKQYYTSSTIEKTNKMSTKEFENKFLIKS